MELGLIGYGQMGREIERIARERGHGIAFIIDENNRSEGTADVLRRADVVVEFTYPSAAFDNISACLRAGVPVVSGTTGWMDRFGDAQELCRQVGGGFFYASNYSIGMNLFFELNQRLAQLMKGYPSYAPRIEEIHHTRKKDAPSGTALTLAGGILAENERFSGWSDALIPPTGNIGMTSIREGNVTGIHAISYVSPEDKITIRHEIFSRSCLAAGAVAAAEFMAGRTGLYSMKDLLHPENQG